VDVYAELFRADTEQSKLFTEILEAEFNETVIETWSNREGYASK